jgi:hypothetical protein
MLLVVKPLTNERVSVRRAHVRLALHRKSNVTTQDLVNDADPRT